jgi:hypothetical protein
MDGNSDITAAMVEVLLQSKAGEIILIPAIAEELVYRGLRLERRKSHRFPHLFREARHRESPGQQPAQRNQGVSDSNQGTAFPPNIITRFSTRDGGNPIGSGHGSEAICKGFLGHYLLPAGEYPRGCYPIVYGFHGQSAGRTR